MRIRLVFAIVAALAIAGCTAPSSGAGSGQGGFELLISDAPADIGDFESLEVGFSHARVFSGNNDNQGFEEIDLGDDAVDLTQVTGAKAQSLINTSLEPGNYSKIELYASDIGGVVNGEDVAVKIPPGKLMINKNFEIKPNTTTSFVFDIQVVLRGNQQNNQGYILKPVISESGVVGKDVEVERTGKNKRTEEGSSPSEDKSQAGRN